MLTDGLVSYWKLNEASGARADSTGANNLSDNNSVTNDGNSAKFVAVSTQYLSHDSNASLQMSGNTDFTICAWVKLNSLPSTSNSYSLVTKDDSAANARDYTLDYVTTASPFNGFRLYIQGGGTYIVQAGVTATVGRWYFVVAWYDSSNGQLHLRIDDTLTVDSSNTGATGTDVSSAEFRIGARQYAGANDYADASIGGVGIWKRLLTASEKSYLFNSTFPTHRSTPIIPLVNGSYYESQIYDFNVLVDPTDSSKLMMFVSGMAAPVQSGQQSIGLFRANSTDPYSWIDQGQILTANVSGWESGGQGIRLGSVVYVSGTFYLYYCSDNSIGVATSVNNGASWTKYASNPILTRVGQGRDDGGSVSQPIVIDEAGSWTMIYLRRQTGGNFPIAYRYATSADGFTWTKGGSGDILGPFSGGMNLYPEQHQLFKIGSSYYLQFEAGEFDTAVPPFRIYIADSTAVTGPYSNVRPVFIESNNTGTFDRFHTATAFVFEPTGRKILYYCGAGEHALPVGTNHWPGGVTNMTDAQITQYPLSATYPFEVATTASHRRQGDRNLFGGDRSLLDRAIGANRRGDRGLR